MVDGDGAVVGIPLWEPVGDPVCGASVHVQVQLSLGNIVGLAEGTGLSVSDIDGLVVGKKILGSGFVIAL